MNKKIKIIELMQKCANKENIPERIVYKNTVFTLNDCKNYYNEEKDERLLDYIIPTFSNLNDEVEILEDNTEEIEELEKEQEAIANPKTMLQEIRFYYDSNKMGDKINEIIRYIKRKDKNND